MTAYSHIDNNFTRRTTGINKNKLVGPNNPCRVFYTNITVQSSGQSHLGHSLRTYITKLHLISTQLQG